MNVRYYYFKIKINKAIYQCSIIVFIVLHHAFLYVDINNVLVKGMGENTPTFYKPHLAKL